MSNFKEPENFFNNSTVNAFKNDSKNKMNDSLCIDYDARTYLRVMKLFKQQPETSFEYPKKIPLIIRERMKENFHMRFYLPKEKIAVIGRKIERVVVMINGLNELDHFHLYDLLGEFFANNGMAAVLLPTPLHLNRRLEYNKDGEPVWPVELAIKHPELFYLNYLQTYKELNHLIDKIKGKKVDEDYSDDFGFYDNYFAGENTDIVLFGYSLGGVKSLAYFMSDFKPMDSTRTQQGNVDYEYIENDYIKRVMPLQKFYCCITLNSGPNLSESNIKAIYPLAIHKWKELVTNAITVLNKDRKRLIEKEHFEPKLLDCLQFLYGKHEFMDDGDIIHCKKRLEGITENYLSILSGKDQIVDGLRVMEDIHIDTLFNQFIVAKADHFPAREKSKWHEMLPMVERSTLDFINSCNTKLYQRKMLEEKIKTILENNNLIEYVKEKCKTVFHRDHFEYITNRLNNLEKTMFIKYYFRSKAFYATFQEVVRKISSKET